MKNLSNFSIRTEMRSQTDFMDIDYFCLIIIIIIRSPIWFTALQLCIISYSLNVALSQTVWLQRGSDSWWVCVSFKYMLLCFIIGIIFSHFFLDILRFPSHLCYSAHVTLPLHSSGFLSLPMYCFPLSRLYVTSRLSLTWSKYMVSAL